MCVCVCVFFVCFFVCFFGVCGGGEGVCLWLLLLLKKDLEGLIVVFPL